MPVSSIPSRVASGPLSTSPRAPVATSTARECLSANTSDRRSSPSPSQSPSPQTPPSPSRSGQGQPETASSSQGPRHPARPASSDFISDKATAAFIRRSLCARHLADKGRRSPAPIHDLLPPLTSRNDVDLQLYALISIILREFVQNWYNKITPDETFIAEIVQVIAHCTRALEQRLRQVDLESLIFDEIPELLAIHIRAHRAATDPVTQPPLETDPRQIYHSLWPLPALSPVPRPEYPASVQAQAENESTYRQLLVHGVLAVLLPTEDLENECLTSLVGQILSELVIGNMVAHKLSEPWLIWELLVMMARLVRKRTNPNDILDAPADRTAQAPDPNSTRRDAVKSKSSWSLHQTFWSFVHWIFLMAGFIRLTMNIMVLSWSLPPRPNPSTVEKPNHGTQKKNPLFQSHEAGTHARTQSAKIPIIRFHIWQCMGDIIEIEERMPWLRGTLSMMQWISMKGPGRVAALNGTLDRLMSHYISIHVLDPAHLPPLLRTIRAALFPNNAPGVSSLKPPSSDEQLAALRRRCASALWGLLPRTVGELYYGTNIRAWSDMKDGSVANERTIPRTAPLNNTARSALIHAPTTNPKDGTAARPSHMPISDENRPQVRINATSSPQAKKHSQVHDMSDLNPLWHENEDEMKIISDIETGIVDIFSDSYCNKHLIYSILELVLVRLVPELAEKGVGELWEERLH